MTNEELRTKIVEILEETEYEWVEEKNGYILQIFYDKLADALIAAWIRDMSEIRSLADNVMLSVIVHKAEVSSMEQRAKEAEHRAEVAEKAGRIIQRDMARVFDISNPRVCELIANIWDLAKKQAEKELAEGNGGKKEV